MTHSYDFTLPKATANKHFALIVAGFVSGSLISILMLGGARALPILFVTLPVLLGFIYYLLRTWVYVTLSPEGIQGKGQTGRRVLIPWSTQLFIEKTHVSGVKGIKLRAADHSSFIGKTLHMVFVPYAILESDDFQQVVDTYASPTHSLRKFNP